MDDRLAVVASASIGELRKWPRSASEVTENWRGVQAGICSCQDEMARVGRGLHGLEMIELKH